MGLNLRPRPLAFQTDQFETLLAEGKSTLRTNFVFAQMHKNGTRMCHNNRGRRRAEAGRGGVEQKRRAQAGGGYRAKSIKRLDVVWSICPYESGESWQLLPPMPEVVQSKGP